MKYGFIGCGNMGGAIARALAKKTNDILLADVSDNARILAETLGCSHGDNNAVVQTCDRVFLAVKPHMLESVLTPLRSMLQERKPLLISMAAGVEIKKIQHMAATPLPIIRIMPNTPVTVGKGMILYCANEFVTDEMIASFLADMQYAGRLDALDEKLIDAASAVSGCGPAYMYMLIEALADGGVCCGLPRAKAMEYAAATMAGAAEMVLQSGQHPGALKDAVCSPGGSTIAGVAVLEQNGFRSAAIECVKAAYLKTLDLGK